jgi:D-glycero-D-manno-heptose 1,7-bisphosphate phosphatase
MRWVILDRDGVINYDSPAYIKSAMEWQPIPKSLEAIAQLNQAGFKVVVATNQSGIARNLYTLETLQQIHHKMHQALAALGGKITEIFYCPHAPGDNCLCRKPRPGLLHQFAKQFNLSLTGLPMIGDSLRDLQAASAAGCQPILVNTGNGYQTLQQHPELAHTICCRDDLYSAAQWLIHQNQ